jgi:chloride channel protein, CIC family
MVQSEGLLLVVILISVLSGAAAVGLHHDIHFVTHLMQALGAATHDGWHTLVIVMVPALGGLLTGLILRFLVPAVRGSGIPQVKLDLAMPRGEIPLTVALGKFVTTPLAVGSGESTVEGGPIMGWTLVPVQTRQGVR